MQQLIYGIFLLLLSTTGFSEQSGTHFGPTEETESEVKEQADPEPGVQNIASTPKKREINQDYKPKPILRKPATISLRSIQVREDIRKNHYCNAALVSKHHIGSESVPITQREIDEIDRRYPYGFGDYWEKERKKALEKLKNREKVNVCEFGFLTSKDCTEGTLIFGGPEHFVPLGRGGFIPKQPGAYDNRPALETSQKEHLASQPNSGTVAIFVKGNCKYFDDSEVFKIGADSFRVGDKLTVKSVNRVATERVVAEGDKFKLAKSDVSHAYFRSGTPVVNSKGELVAVSNFYFKKGFPHFPPGFRSGTVPWINEVLKKRYKTSK